MQKRLWRNLMRQNLSKNLALQDRFIALGNILFAIVLMALPTAAWADWFGVSCKTRDGGEISVSVFNGTWSIMHHNPRSGYIWREGFFDIKEVPGASSGIRQWQGIRKGTPNLRMVGIVTPKSSGRYSYDERFFDDNDGGRQIDRIFATGCKADEPPPAARLSAPIALFPPNFSYDKARVTLRASGYKPVITSRKLSRCSIGFEARCRRYPEVEGCSGTGLARCTFLWKSSRGALIQIGTIGESDPPIVEKVQCRANCSEY